MTRMRLLAAALTLAAASSVASADTWNKKTKITFSGPFQVPAANTSAGVVALPPGTYVFRLVSSQSNRNIVEVTDAREKKVFTTILAINDYRLNASSKTVMYFSERKAGAPMAVKSWFYPGDNFGQRFVYPKVKAQEIAAATNQPVPSHTVEVIETTKYVAVPVFIQTPAKQEVAYAPATLEKNDATDTAGEDGEAVKAPAAPAAEPAKLPKTANSIQFLGLMGALLLAAAFVTRRSIFRLQ